MTYDIISVTSILKACAVRKTVNGFLFSLPKISLNLVSRPIHTKAILNNVFWNPFVTFHTALAVSVSKQKLNTREARINPTTNLGNLSHITPKVGFSC